MRALLLCALLTLTAAANVPAVKPENSQAVLPPHQVEQVQGKPQAEVPSPTAMLSGQVPPIVVPYPDLLPPHEHTVAGQSHVVPHVINHQATGTLHQRDTLLEHNKVVPHVLVALPGQAPLDIGDKVNKLQQHVNQIMVQAQTHIPLAINQAIRQQQAKEKTSTSTSTSTSTTTTTTATPATSSVRATVSTTSAPASTHVEHAVPLPNPHVVPVKAARFLAAPSTAINSVVHVPHLLKKQIEHTKLGKCSFQCESRALPVCASNGKCFVEFPSQCELSKWNCFNTKNVFSQVHDDDCQDIIWCSQLDSL